MLVLVTTLTPALSEPGASVAVAMMPVDGDLMQHALGAALAIRVFAFGAVVGVGPGRGSRRAPVDRRA